MTLYGASSLLDSAVDANFCRHEWGVDALATDPIDPRNVYIAVGMYTNSWDPNNGSILRSSDFGETWARTPLPFKVGGNMPGRGMGERLAVDPKNNKIIYFGARSGNGLWKSVDQGLSFQKVTSFTAVGTYEADPTDTSGYGNDINGLTTVTFDTTSPLKEGATSRIFVGTADTNSSTFVSNDAGTTWTAMAGQPSGVFPHKMKFSTAEKALYISYNSESGPYSAGFGYVYRVAANGTFTDITPPWAAANSITIGYGGLALDTQTPGTLMVAAMNLWYPDVQIFRSTNSGASWIQIWDWVDGVQENFYTYDTVKAPWINAQRQPGDTKILGWMVESLEIDPFDSNHLLYGTGVTIYGSHNLKAFPQVHITSLADGIEEEAVQALISPPGVDVPLISAVSDVGGFVQYDLDKSPADSFEAPFWSTTTALDYAGFAPKNIARIGNSQLAISSNAGVNWTLNTAVPSTASGGSIAFAADASAIVWTSSAGSLLITSNTSTEIPSLPSGIVVVADKVNPEFFYAADTSGLYISSDTGRTFNFTTPLPSSGSIRLAVHPAQAGDIWLSTNQGVYHSTNFGVSFMQSPNVESGYAIAVGKGKGEKGTNVYSFNTIGGVAALRMSENEGASWRTISDEGNGFGSNGANRLAASWEVEGRVYVGTNGRGVFYGSPR